MQASLLTNLLLPLALGVIMLGLGMGLALDDFRRVARYPKAVLLGLGLQTLLLPWVAFGLALGFGLRPELAVGLMLLAASPGGATANIYSHLARGDVALNITLTAINSLLCLLTLPVILNLSLEYFMGAGQYVPPPAGLRSPALWGTRERIGDLFESDAALIATEKRHFVFRYRSPEHWLAVFRGFYGPVLKAFEATDAARRIELQQEMLALADRFNRAEDGTMVVPGEYLQVVVTRQ